MDLLNIKLIILGIFFTSIFLLGNFFFCFFCILFKIKILEFSIFLSPKFSLKIQEINNIKFILGWLPISMFVKIFGMTSDINEQQKFLEEDLSFAFFNKEKYKKMLVFFSPVFAFFFFGIIISYLLLKFKNINFSIYDLLFYFEELLYTLFGSEEQKIKFGILSNTFSTENNSIVFSFLIFSCIMFVWILPYSYYQYLISNPFGSKNKEKIALYFSNAITILIIWKTPALMFNYYNTSTILIYSFNFLLGTYLSGALTSFILTSCLKTYYNFKKNKGESVQQFR